MNNIIYNLKIKTYLTNFFRLNLISLRLNNQYKLNKYLTVILILGIISSIFVRTNLNEELLNINNEYIMSIIKIVCLLSFIYSIKLIFDIIKRCIQAYKIIPNFITWYKEDKENIRSITSLYYLQNVFFILLSILIFYNIIIKLNLLIDNIHLYIISIGIISSIIFLVTIH